ncbi:unnamed protein product [Amoebophrya sp. A25]|nr:unnamed protein product [Amoebophrya sp. A25]|eukprot:GSA25T00024416001.1
MVRRLEGADHAEAADDRRENQKRHQRLFDGLKRLCSCGALNCDAFSALVGAALEENPEPYCEEVESVERRSMLASKKEAGKIKSIMLEESGGGSLPQDRGGTTDGDQTNEGTKIRSEDSTTGKKFEHQVAIVVERENANNDSATDIGLVPRGAVEQNKSSRPPPPLERCPLPPDKGNGPSNKTGQKKTKTKWVRVIPVVPSD